MTGRGVTEDQYQRAQNVWKTFQMSSMKEYMETYCLSDTLLLCEIFERFRTESMNNFGIEPCHYLSLPGFAYQAFLKTTGVELDYITDEEIYTMLAENLRGAIVSQASVMKRVPFLKMSFQVHGGIRVVILKTRKNDT